jgi:hypothetical protein
MTRKPLILTVKPLAIPLAIPLAFVLGCDVPSPAGPSGGPAADAAVFAAAGNAGRLVRTDDVGGPFYARIVPVPPHIYSDGTWVGIAFYRDPACVPGDFNLLAFFDLVEAFPEGPPRPILCTLLVQGHSLWHGAPGNGAPHTVVSAGNGPVPVWFALEQEVLAAMADGDLTIIELEALGSLIKGEADHFDELLHPHGIPGQANGGGHPAPKIVLNAHGTLADGRRFQFHITDVEAGARNVRIRFR